MQHVPLIALSPDELDQLIAYHARMMPAVTTTEQYRHHEARRNELIRQRNGRFDEYGQEHADVAARAQEVFGSDAKAQSWLRRTSESGMSDEQAMERLTQIEHGMAP